MSPSKKFTGSSGNQENESSAVKVNPVDVVKRGFRILVKGGFRKISPTPVTVELKSEAQQDERATPTEQKTTGENAERQQQEDDA
ncbi:MAG TPA: hypothetical protein VF599_17365 [Pyrinomonadaceae bacterium]|jgi:hypothetical protein